MPFIDFKPSEKTIIIDNKEHEIWTECNQVEYDYLLECDDEEFFKKLILCNNSEFPDRLEANGTFCNSIYTNANFARIVKSNGFFKINLSCSYEWKEWEYLFRLDRFLELFLEELKKLDLISDIDPYNFFNTKDPYYDISIMFSYPENDNSPKHHIDIISSELKRIHNRVLIQIDRIYSTGSFFAHFNFSEKNKKICEQYLMYFGEFLIDLGIDTNTSIREYGNEVLFEVIPKNKNEAIKKIYQAFEIFLSLPKYENQISITTSKGLIGEIKIKKLLSVIEHLKSQLSLSKQLVEIREKEISVIRDMYNSNIIESSLVDMRGKSKEENIYLFDKTVTIKPYKGKFFEINLPKIINKITKKESS